METPLPISTLIANYPELEGCLPAITSACNAIISCYRQDGTLYLCGNGGSSADADHISGEFLKGFCRKRPLSPEECARLSAVAPAEDAAMLSEKLQHGLPAIPLNNLLSAATATANDLGGDLPAAQTLFAFARPGDAFLGISTSGNAKNIRYAMAVARMRGLTTIGLTGRKGGWLAEHADIAIRVPADDTYRIQEYHLPVYHTICRVVEEAFFTV